MKSAHSPRPILEALAKRYRDSLLERHANQEPSRQRSPGHLSETLAIVLEDGCLWQLREAKPEQQLLKDRHVSGRIEIER
jgi:hypothetical protein